MSDSTSSTSNLHHPLSKPKRPIAVTVLILMVLSYTVLGWFGLLDALRRWDFLQTLPLTVPLFYLVLRSALMAVFGLPLIWGLWIGRPWAWYATQIYAVVLVTFYWLDRVLVAQPAVIGERWPFMVAITLLELFLVTLALWLPSGRRFFAR
jgi:hypothetical protein